MIYYNLSDDIKKYPWATFMFIYGGRKTGKTYSSLKYVVDNEIPFAFMKRTIQDVKVLCAGRKLNWSFHRTDRKANDDIDDEHESVKIDMSPFAPLNRDFGWNIKAYLLDAQSGIGVFLRENEDGEPYGKPLGYLLAISGAGKYKGFDLTAQHDSKDFFMIFDEFVPPKGVKRIAGCDEGGMLLDLYMTLERDRVQRGKNPIKLIGLANADSIVCPTISTMNLIDVVADMQQNGTAYYENQEKKLILHKLPSLESEEDLEREDIYKLMEGTVWKDKSLNNNFADADFCLINKDNSLKGYTGYIKLVLNNNKEWYIWHNKNKDKYHMTCKKPPQKCKETYHMKSEVDRIAFFRYFIMPLITYSLEGKVTVEGYEMQFFIFNYAHDYLDSKASRF